MGFNFFNWLREGVRQSVLMGVSDAVTHLGTPRDGDDVQQRLTTFLTAEGTPGALPPRVTNQGQRKKLGRTLEQIQASTAKAA